MAKSSAIFQALSDPTRRHLFELLVRQGEANVRGLTELVKVSQPMVSRHLSALKHAGLVVDRYQGREHYFRAEPHGLGPLAAWMEEQILEWSKSQA